MAVTLSNNPAVFLNGMNSKSVERFELCDNQIVKTCEVLMGFEIWVNQGLNHATKLPNCELHTIKGQ